MKWNGPLMSLHRSNGATRHDGVAKRNILLSLPSVLYAVCTTVCYKCEAEDRFLEEGGGKEAEDKLRRIISGQCGWGAATMSSPGIEFLDFLA